MIALYLIPFPIMQNVISYYLRMNTNSYTQTHSHKHTCSHTCFSSPWPVYFQNAPNLHTHVTDSRMNTCTDTHAPVAGGNTHFTAMATAKLTQFPWRWRRGRLLVADPRDTPIFY